MHPKIDLHSHFITKCRAFCEIFYSFIGFLLFFFSLAANGATPEQLSMIKEAAENHVLSTVDMPAGGELLVNAANIDDRLFATDCRNLSQQIHHPAMVLRPTSPYWWSVNRITGVFMCRFG